MSLKFVFKVRIDSILALVQIIAGSRAGHITNLTLRNHWGILINVSKYHNAGI